MPQWLHSMLQQKQSANLLVAASPPAHPGTQTGLERCVCGAAACEQSGGWIALAVGAPAAGGISVRWPVPLRGTLECPCNAQTCATWSDGVLLQMHQDGS